MDEGNIRMQAQMYALVADMNAIMVSVEGMKATNVKRESQGMALAYDEQAFNSISEELEVIAVKLRKEI